jgi:hypothetical protein
MSHLLAPAAPYPAAAGKRLFWLRQAFRLAAVTLAGLHAWAAAHSHSMNPDGVNYLDIGDAYFRGDWSDAINTVWSPLYSWILGTVLWLFHPSIQWEFPTVHLVNLVIFVLAMFAFEFMWGQLARTRRAVPALATNWITWPEWAWWSTGYLVFIWVSLGLIQIWAVTPDMLMAAFVYIAAGLVVRIRAGHDRWHTFALLGLSLGLGFLSKSVMFPVSLLFLAAAFAAATNVRRAALHTGVAVAVFLLVGGPYVLLMTTTRGEFTYGEAGKLTYVRHVNGVAYPHWQGKPEGDGVPVHPPRQILDEPPIYEFGTPIGGTYPISYDQAYWYEGVTVRFDVMNQLRQLLASAVFYVDLFVFQQAALVFSLILVYALRKWQRLSFLGGGRALLLSLVGLLALLLYAPVLVAGRYVGAFVVLFWSDLLVQARLPLSPANRRVITTLSALMAVFLSFNILMFNIRGFADLTDDKPLNVTVSGAPSWPGAVAEELWLLGIDPGDQVAVIGYGLDSFWARLGRTKIVAELLEWQADPFWLGDSATQEEVLRAFASTGAKAIVAEYAPAYARLPGWRQVEDSSFYIYVFDER